MWEEKREEGKCWRKKGGGNVGGARGREEREGPRIHLLLVGPAPEMFGLIETIFFQWL